MELLRGAAGKKKPAALTALRCQSHEGEKNAKSSQGSGDCSRRNRCNVIDMDKSRRGAYSSMIKDAAKAGMGGPTCGENSKSISHDRRDGGGSWAGTGTGARVAGEDAFALPICHVSPPCCPKRLGPVCPGGVVASGAMAATRER